jgi:hypothetical protein
MTDLLNDGVWARLDPHAGRLTRRVAARLWLVALVCAVLAVAALFVWRAGLIVPRIERDRMAGGFVASVEAPEFTVAVPLMNNGQLTETVLGVGRSGPGLTLEPPVDGYPLTLPSRTGVELRLRYKVTDCAAVPAGDWPIPVRISRPWGAATVYVSGPTIGVRAPWQHMLAAQACRTG